MAELSLRDAQVQAQAISSSGRKYIVSRGDYWVWHQTRPTKLLLHALPFVYGKHHTWTHPGAVHKVPIKLSDKSMWYICKDIDTFGGYTRKQLGERFQKILPSRERQEPIERVTAPVTVVTLLSTVLSGNFLDVKANRKRISGRYLLTCTPPIFNTW